MSFSQNNTKYTKTVFVLTSCLVKVLLSFNVTKCNIRHIITNLFSSQRKYFLERMRKSNEWTGICFICNSYVIKLELFRCFVCFLPSSSSGAIRLAAKLNMDERKFEDSSTASFMAFMGSELILLMLPAGAWKQNTD